MVFRLKIYACSFLLTLTLCLSPFNLLSASESQVKWKVLETRYSWIMYQTTDHLDTFQKSIRFGRGWWSTSSPFAQFTEEENRKITTMKIDAIFKRTQQILGMIKKGKKVSILLYPDRTSLDQAYFIAYNKESPFRAWYEYSTHTISLNVSDCHEGMVAHELAHSIIDNYLNVRPPKNTAEILAKYVDKHLK